MSQAPFQAESDSQGSLLQIQSIPDQPTIPSIPNGGSNNNGPGRQKRNSLACIRCRTRHIRCPGGNPCKKCQLARAKCEYVEADKKIVVSMKYLSKLHDDISRLKKDNATLRNNLKQEKVRVTGSAGNMGPVGTVADQLGGDGGLPPAHSAGTPYMGGRGNTSFNSGDSSRFSTTFGTNQNFSVGVGGPSSSSSSSNFTEVIHPSLDKHGRLIQSRTGEKLYVGSSSMTLFGLEIQNMVPSFSSSRLFPSISSKTNSPVHTPGSVTSSTSSIPNSSTAASSSKRETKILEKEGNAYKITLAKTNTRPGVSINFSLPSYSYAMLLVDTFVNYNDGCFYFFNEGLVKKFLTNLYAGKMEENKRILKRNISPNKGPAIDENTIKKDTDDDTILETVWFCKVLLIFATGEMYLGTESDVHRKNRKANISSSVSQERANNSNQSGSGSSASGSKAAPKPNSNTNSTGSASKNTLPGAGFFYQASELFTGLFASGAIDNTVKDGGIEVMLLYAFYLQVADCTIASYFYFGLALRSTLILGWHVDADSENLNRFELEHRRRIWWTVYMYERMLSLKAGLPLSFADDSVSTEFPVDISMALDDFPKDENDVRGFFVFPPAEYINNCVIITQINAMILLSLYTKQPTINILPVVSDLVQKLMTWKTALPEFLKVDFQGTGPSGEEDNLKVSRLVVNLMTEYFQGINLAVRPLLFHFATKKLKELQQQENSNKYVDLTKYLKNVLTLLNASFQALINSIRCIWALVPENMVALFGWMDREYLFTSASTLILFNASFGVHDATKDHLDHALTIFTKMKRLGNYPAALRRSQLLKLISVLDFNGVMQDLLKKHDDEGIYTNEEGLEENYAGASSFTSLASAGLDFAAFQGAGSESHAQFLPQESGVYSGQSIIRDIPESLEMEIEPQVQTTNGPPSFSNGGINYAQGMGSGNGISDHAQSFGGGDVYMNSDLAGIEGVTYLDEEQKLWNEITNDAVWLNMPGNSHNQSSQNIAEEFGHMQPNQTQNQSQGKDYGGTIIANNEHQGIYGGHDDGGYSDIINQEFQSM